MATPSSGATGAMAPRRTARPRWSDPRLLLGIVLVLTSVVLGVRLVAFADDGDDYWALAADVRTGDAVTAEDLVAVRARLSDDTGYLRTDEELPARLADLRWAADTPAGTLLGRGAWQSAEQARTVEVPMLVQAGSLPYDLAPGDTIDVWVSRDGEDERAGDVSQVLSQVRVASVGDTTESFTGLGRPVVVEVDEARAGEGLGLLATGDVVVVRRP